MNGTLEERVARLEALEAIHALKARYAALADAKYTSAHQRVDDATWDATARAQAACFTKDARWFGGARFGGTVTGRKALAEWFARSPWRFAMHFYVSPEITVTATDAAEGRWRLWQVGLPEDGSPAVLLFATTLESYRRVGADWLIAGMRFEEIHQVSLADTPDGLTCMLPKATS